jgi:hypothetical protein
MSARAFTLAAVAGALIVVTGTSAATPAAANPATEPGAAG